MLRAIELEGVLEALDGGGILAAIETAQADGIGGERFVGGVGAPAEEPGGLGCGFDGARIFAEGEGGLGEFEQGLRIFRSGAEGGKQRFVGLERGTERTLLFEAAGGFESSGLGLQATGKQDYGRG